MVPSFLSLVAFLQLRGGTLCCPSWFPALSSRRRGGPGPAKCQGCGWAVGEKVQDEVCRVELRVFVVGLCLVDRGKITEAQRHDVWALTPGCGHLRELRPGTGW